MRTLSNFEKMLVNRMNSGQGNNLPNLIDPFLHDVSISVNTETNDSTILFESALKEQRDRIIESIAEIESIIIQSVNLIKLLEDNGYILTYTRSNEIQNPFTYGDASINQPYLTYRFPDKRISELLTRYSMQDIFLTPELSVFIGNGYISREEKRFHKQVRMTMIAIGVALLGVLANLFFNLKHEYFDDGQKINSTQFQMLLNNSYRPDPYTKDTITFNKRIYRDTTLIETVISSEVTTNSTIRK